MIFKDFGGKMKNCTLKGKFFHSFQYLLKMHNMGGGEMIFQGTYTPENVLTVQNF